MEQLPKLLKRVLYQLREEVAYYNPLFGAKNNEIGYENGFFWSVNNE